MWYLGFHIFRQRQEYWGQSTDTSIDRKRSSSPVGHHCCYTVKMPFGNTENVLWDGFAWIAVKWNFVLFLLKPPKFVNMKETKSLFFWKCVLSSNFQINSNLNSKKLYLSLRNCVKGSTYPVNWDRIHARLWRGKMFFDLFIEFDFFKIQKKVERFKYFRLKNLISY